MSDRLPPKIALPVGDPAGIGPEICLKTVLTPEVRDFCRPILVSDPGILEQHARLIGIPSKFIIYNNFAEVDWEDNAIAILARDQFSGTACMIGSINAENGQATLDSASVAITAALDGEVDAVIAAPHTQTSIAKAGIDFDGYPSFVARETGIAPDDVYLMLCFNGKRIAHCTLHVSVRKALDLITTDRVQRIIYAVNKTLIKIGIKNPSILVSGINPHAGENRLFGNEDTDIISPAIKKMQSAGVNVQGPIGADIMLQEKDIDAFIVMLHDQGHIPAKLVAPRKTVAMSIGSPILFSTVAHGSALDIAGKGIADHSAIIEAIKLLSAADPFEKGV